MERETSGKAGEALKVAIYSRKSKFTGKGESVENQIRMCRDYISCHPGKFGDIGEEDILVFEDEGYSGKDLDRPQFQEMMRHARQRRLDYIICYRLDRISRSVSDFSSLAEEFYNLGISFICIKEDFDTKTPMGRAMMNMASTFAQLERETIAERVRDNMLMLARTGRWLGGTLPTGFVSEKVTEVIVEGKSKTSCRLKWNPDEMKTVKTIFTKFLELQSVSGVGKYLIRKNIRSRTGGYFSLPGIRNILTNPVYCIADRRARDYFEGKGADVCFEEKNCSGQCGLISYGKRDYTRKASPRLDVSEWIVAVGKHRGVVEGRDWVAVQSRLEGNRPDGDPHGSVHNGYSLLSGLIFCKKCGERMFAKQRSNSETLFDYICSSKLRGGTALCDCRNLNGKETDGLVCGRLADRLEEGPDAWKRFRKARKEIQDSAGEKDAAGIDAGIKDRKRRIANYVRQLGEDRLSPAASRYFRDEIAELDREIGELNGRRERLEPAPRRQTELRSVVLALSSLKSSFGFLAVQERRELIRLLVERIEWDGENLDIYLYGG